MKFTTRYNYEPQPGLVNTEPSRTYQECKDDCDINVLYRRYLSKGLTPPNVRELEARYADISEAQTFEEILNIQNDVKHMFTELPSDIREACDYKVDNFVKIISEPSKNKEVQEFQSIVFDKLGMRERKQQFQKIQNKQAESVETQPAEEPTGESAETGT